ncbi:uncharacterized protein LOC115956665 [Quercus lobata]|uniref:uncharacterized protein LOC115956665 n=1 Tax=Quercus lobata TaxID=97700 RepID=UPI001243DEB3|nr:uncharacterized protein LOC115956665 [Quercus lobata]
MGGDSSRRNQNLYCTYHKDKGHIIEQRRVLKDHLGQLVKAGYLKEFVANTGNRDAGQGTQQRGNLLPPPLGVIEPPEKKLKVVRDPIAFNDDDLEGTIQPHDDALVVTAWIKGFIVKRVMVDQGSGTNVMYSDLFRGLRLKKEDLSKYDTPLVGFDGQVVILEGQISLPVNMKGKEVTVAFVVVVSFSPYTAILGRLWIHAIGVVPSTLHVKVKFHTEQGIAVVRGSQQAARQC